MKLVYSHPIPVAAHRGNSKYFPENTMVSFRSAVALNVDMIETDLHMTKDGEIILMHDHTVDRTSDGVGLIREKTLAEMKQLDVGKWKGGQFCGERVPTFVEFLELFKDYPKMLFNIELKDYPADSYDFAIHSAEKSISMMEKYGILDRSVINTWSGELNEYLADRYGGKLRIHAYSPQELMGQNQKRFVYSYAYCVCLFGTKKAPVVNKKLFDLCKSYGVEPWVFLREESQEFYDLALENGAMLFTSNDPQWAMQYLHSKGLH